MYYVLTTQLWYKYRVQVNFLQRVVLFLDHNLTDLGSCGSGNIYVYCACVLVYDQGEKQEVSVPSEQMLWVAH